MSSAEGLAFLEAVLIERDEAGFRRDATASKPRAIVLAVSGGPDSMALMVLAAENRAALKRLGFEPHVVTVDHGLRPASAVEAMRVGEVARSLGLPHWMLRWEGEKPASNLQAEARDARYWLLVEAARGLRAAAILTAHHQDDQIETHLIAAGRHAGDRGLAGMRARREIAPGLALARPVLAVPSERLRATVRDRGIWFFDDPSNADRRFQRVRLRQRLEASPASRLGFLRAIAGHAARRDEADRRLGRLIEELLRDRRLVVDTIGTVRLDADVPGSVLADLGVDLLGRLLLACGGGAHVPGRTALESLLAALRNGPCAATLGGARVIAARPLIFLREYGRSGPPSLLLSPAGGDMVFDRRLAVSLAGGVEAIPSLAAGSCLVALGAFGRGNAVERSLPVLVSPDGRILAVPEALRGKIPDAPSRLDLREQVGWRIAVDLPTSASSASEALGTCDGG